MKHTLFNLVRFTGVIIIVVMIMIGAGCYTGTSNPVSPQFTVNVGADPDVGDFLVDGKGMTLYWTTKDAVGKSNITGNTLAIWPIFYTQQIVVPSSLVSSDFGTITRDGGKMQTTFRGWPLYYYVNDKASGDMLGQGIGNVWFIIDPTNFPPETTSPVSGY